MEPDYDVLIIGSGFGGSVSALRLTEKGYRVGVLEAGPRYSDADFAKTSWDLRKFLWAPKFGMYGIQRIHLLRNVMILAGAGVGGGSLNYANTLYIPPDPFFNDPQWKNITDWRAELMPHYEQAQRMLGVVKNPTFTDADKIIKEVAEDMGCADTFVATPVGVFFGPDGEKTPGKTVPDPYFGGAGPARTGCIECGECMTGCRHGAKNTLVKNYLGLAEKAGAQVHPLTTVTSFQQRGDGLWEVATRRTNGRVRRGKRTFTAKYLIVAAGTYNTQKLLFKVRDTGKLTKLSDKLGVLTRTNSESIVGAQTREVPTDMDLTHGVAITSSIHPTPDTHIEPVRYGKGSNAMGMLQTLMTDGAGPKGTDVPRWKQFLNQAGEDPRELIRLLNPQRWSERTVIALVMQHLDNSITTFTKRGPGGCGGGGSIDCRGLTSTTVGSRVLSVSSSPACRITRVESGPSRRVYVTSLCVASTVTRNSRHRNRNRSRDRLSGSCGSSARKPSSSRRPPKPATRAIQAPASDAMCSPSRVLWCRSRRSIKAAS